MWLINIARKIVYIVLLILFFQVAAFAQIVTFKDLSKSHPAYDSVYNMVNVYRLMSGYEDHTFRGEEEITRFQFVGLLVGAMAYLEKISGKDLSSRRTVPESFSDLSIGHWAYKSVNDAANKYQIMGGYEDQTFKGDKFLTRLELATILGKILFRLGN